MDKSKQIAPHESELQGRWIEVEGRITEDSMCKRIELLIAEYLVKIGKDVSGWLTLFQDPEDGRYWQRSFPHSDWQGGGPPLLTVLTEKEARERYPHLFQ